MKKLTAPFTRETARSLHSGEQYLLRGVIYTARDAAHLRLCQALERGEDLPIPMENTVIYFAGPAPAAPGQAIGSAGPTTSYRMDAYSPTLIGQGLTGMIGKGRRSREVQQAMLHHGAVYLGATGGCGALIAQCVRKAQVVAYEDLGAEAIFRLEVEDLPVTVIMDAHGNDLYDSGPAAYLAQRDGSL